MCQGLGGEKDLGFFLVAVALCSNKEVLIGFVAFVETKHANLSSIHAFDDKLLVLYLI